MTDPREALLVLLGRPDHAPMSTHDPRDGSCQSCPWPLHEMPPEDIADAILAEFDVTPRGEAEDAAPTGHDHEWQRRQNVTSRGYRMPPYEVCVVDGCGAARQVAESPWEQFERLVREPDEFDPEVKGRPLYALTPPTLPSVEDVARACGDPGSITPRREGESVPRWSARAVLALFEKGEDRG